MVLPRLLLINQKQLLIFLCRFLVLCRQLEFLDSAEHQIEERTYAFGVENQNKTAFAWSDFLIN